MSVRLSHLRITASAGTGKTLRLTDRIVELLLLGVEPRKILALTFTRKAAGEFLRKLLEKLAQGAEKPSILHQCLPWPVLPVGVPILWKCGVITEFTVLLQNMWGQCHKILQ